MSHRRFIARIVVIAAGMAVPASACRAATETLQEGAEGYRGACTSKTVWGEKGQVANAQPGLLYLRGAHNRLQLRFELPKWSAGAERKLARARLMLFLPAARKPNMYTEIFCHEVTAGGQEPSIDQKTDYDNGRRAGAVDSVELFAPPHTYWEPYPWLPLGVPKNGRWIEFNVTPLVEKWIKSPAANHGVMLVPTSCMDNRFPSTWEIDIPSPAFPGDARKRPKLVLEFAPLRQEYLVGMTDGLRRICDRSTRYQYAGGYETAHKMSMAANEYEGFQVVVYPMLSALKNVRFTWTDLTGPEGAKIPAGDVEYFCQDFYKVRANWKTRDKFYRGKLYETADPLPPARPTTAPRHVHTPFYFRVRTHPGTPAGTYRGGITLHGDDLKPTKLSLEVKVWPYAIPEKWNFHTMGQFVWGNCQRFHGKDWSEQLARKYYDFLLAHRFSPTEQYSQRLSPRTDMAECLGRGMNTVYLYSVHGRRDQPTKALMDRIKPDYEKVKALGALDYALVYIGDETSNWEKMHSYANHVHAYLPGALVMIGGSVPRKELLGYIDVYDPIIGPNKVYGLEEKAAGVVRDSQQRGEEFYWYVAAGPAWPYPNVQLEYPLICSRVLFWMTWKYAVTGFEYYCYNIWNRNYAAEPAKRYPNVKWLADGWQRGWPSNCDGMLFYPGPISSLRFEAIRDGIEDWESLQVLRDCAEAVRRRKRAGQYRGLIARAEKLLKVDEEIVGNFKTYTMDVGRLLAEREKVGETIARFMEIVPKTEQWDAGGYRLAKSAEVRIARQTARRRKMLRERHLAACKALGVEPLPSQQWEALWPKRTLFAQDFEKDGDWDGAVETENVPPPSKRALAAAEAKAHFARQIRVGIRWDHARATTRNWVRFKYFLNQQTPITVFAFDLTLGNNWEHTIARPVVGKWTELTLDLGEDFREKGGGGRKIRPGDAIDDLFFFVGRPGQKDVQLLVDDVALIGQD